MLSQFMPTWVGDLLAKYGITNIFGSITVFLTGVIYVADKYLGCNLGAVIADANTTLAATCDLPTWFPATWVPVALGTAAAVAFIGKALRPGGFFRSFFGGTAVIVPPTSPASTVNTATPAEVAKP